MKFSPTQLLGLALLIVGLALVGFGLLVLLRAPQFQATTRIMGESEPLLGGNPSPDTSYDPYFIQTTYEIIQSEVVLSNVVATLNLETVWGNKSADGKKLSLPATLDLLRGRMRLEPVRGTKLIAISSFSNDPDEAAKIANGIVDAYIHYRQETQRQLFAKSLAVLQQQYDDQTKEIETLQSQVETLTNQVNSGKAVRDEVTKKLDELIEQHRLFHQKIENDRIDAAIPRDSMVEVVDLAEPPTSPVGLNHFLALALLTLGLISSLAGVLLLKPSPEEAC